MMKRIIAASKKIWALALALGVLLFLYLLHAGPVRQAIARKGDHVTALGRDLAWMENAAAGVKRLRSSGPGKVRGPLLTLVDKTVREAGISGAVRKVAAEAGQSVRVWFGEVEFAAFATWLAKVVETGLTVRECRVNEKEGGKVKAEVKLAGK